jgi:hypothetical protein
MGLPKQIGVVKDEDFCRKCVQAIQGMIGAVSYQKEKDRFCYDLYSGIMNEQDYDYLTKVDKYEYPAKLRFVPLIRPQLDYLRSEEARRPLNLRVFTTDRVSLENKENEFLRKIMETMHGNVVEQYTMVSDALSKINQELQPPPGAAGPDGKPTAPDPKVIAQKQQEAIQLAVPKDMLKQGSVFLQKDIEELDKYMKYGYKDLVETIMDKGMRYLIEKYSIKDKFTSGFEDKMVTDKEIYFVDWNGQDEDPEFRKVDILNFYYSGDDETEWIDECEWSSEIRFMTIPQVLDEFRDDLSKEDYALLEMQSKTYMGMTNNYTANYNGISDRYMVDNSTDKNNHHNMLYAGTEDYSNKVRVMFCYWTSPDAKKIKKSKNKYLEDTPFTHILRDDETVKKDDDISFKYKNDVYRGVCINETIYCRLGKKPVQMRGVDKPGIVGLPYVGQAFNNYSRRPYSLVWATREIQMLYNILHYKRELWIALSGVKGFVMDKSQVPDDMSMKEWMYQRKLGVGWIQTVKEGRVQSSFNQFQTYDDTISQSIETLDRILLGLEELARSITGVSRQSVGDIKPIERVGNTEASINQSHQVTEMLYYTHEKVRRRALAKLANVCKKAWKKGKRAQYITGAFAQSILNIPAGVLDECDMDIFIGNSFKEDQALRELRQVAMQDHSKNLLSLGQLTKLYTVESLRDLEHIVEQYGEMAEQKALAGKKMEQDWEEKMKNLEGQLRVVGEDAKLKYEQSWIEIEKQKVDIERAKVLGDQKVKEEAIHSNENIHAGKVAVENRAISEDSRIKNREIDSGERIHSIEKDLEELRIFIENSQHKEEMKVAKKKQPA